MKTLQQHIKEDFKISKNVRIGKPTFSDIFGNVDIYKWKFEDHQDRNEDMIINFASGFYRTKDKDSFMKDFFILTCEKLIEWYNKKQIEDANRIISYFENAKKIHNWEKIRFECVPGTWWHFVNWLIKHRNYEIGNNK